MGNRKYSSQFKSSVFHLYTTEAKEKRCEIIPTGLIDVILLQILAFSFFLPPYERARSEKARRKYAVNKRIISSTSKMDVS